jgi:hypothetical protein
LLKEQEEGTNDFGTPEITLYALLLNKLQNYHPLLGFAFNFEWSVICCNDEFYLDDNLYNEHSCFRPNITILMHYLRS